MNAPRLVLPLLACLLLAGCSLFGGESTTEPDRTEYEGGRGFALKITNNATDPFDVTIRVVDGVEAEYGRITGTLAPGETLEKWWSLPRPGLYLARFSYQWSGVAQAAQGLDEQRFDSNECAEVWRLTWSLEQQAGQQDAVGHRYLGKTCVEAET